MINNKCTPIQLDLFQLQKQYPDAIVKTNNLDDGFDDLDLSKNVLVCNVKKDNVEHFLDGSARIYYTGLRFPSSVALNKLYYFIPYIGKKCDLDYYGIRDLYIIEIARIGSRREGELDNDPNDLRLVFEIKFVKHLFEDYKPVKLQIYQTFTDTTLEQLIESSKTKIKALPNRLTYISLFSSAGVGCYGFKQENYSCIATVELIERRLNIQKYNHKCTFNSGYICGDITLDETQNRVFQELQMWRNACGLTDVDMFNKTAA